MYDVFLMGRIQTLLVWVSTCDLLTAIKYRISPDLSITYILLSEAEHASYMYCVSGGGGENLLNTVFLFLTCCMTLIGSILVCLLKPAHILYTLSGSYSIKGLHENVQGSGWKMTVTSAVLDSSLYCSTELSCSCLLPAQRWQKKLEKGS